MAGSFDLLRGETQGLAIDATSGFPGDVSIKDTGTPANNRVNSSLNSVLTNTNASTKVTIQNNLTLATTAANKVAQEWDSARNVWAILTEPAATNLCLRSQEFDDAAWGPFNVTVSANTSDTTDPFGTNLADKCTNTAGGDSGEFIFQSITVGSGVTTAASVYAKAGTGTTWFSIAGGSGGGNSALVWFNLSTGSIGSAATTGAGWTNVTHYMEALANGWYRCTAVMTPPGTSFSIVVRECTNDASAVSTNASIYYMFGCQVEAAPTRSSSYIATTSGTVTRAADIVTLATSAFPWSDTNGTIYVDNKHLATKSVNVVWEVSKDASNYVQYYINGGVDPYMVLVTGGSADVNSDAGTVATGTRSQFTYAFKDNDFDASIDGAAAVTDAGGDVTTGYTTLRIGNGVNGAGYEHWGYTYRLVYVPYQRQTVSGDLVTWRYNFTGSGGNIFSIGSGQRAPVTRTSLVGY